MGVELTTALLNRLWAILENGQDTPALVRVGNRLKRTLQTGWMKEEAAKAPADFPQIDIEVGRRGSHSGYNLDPNFAQEAANAGATSAAFDILRTELVTITLKTDRVVTGGINPLKEAVVDDIMRVADLGMPCTPEQSGVVAVGDVERKCCFDFEQRYTRKGEKPFPGQITVITFPVSMLQHGRATLTGQE